MVPFPAPQTFCINTRGNHPPSLSFFRSFCFPLPLCFLLVCHLLSLFSAFISPHSCIYISYHPTLYTIMNSLDITAPASPTDMPSSSPTEKSGVRHTFGYFDPELQSLPALPPSPRRLPNVESLLTPPTSPVSETLNTDPIYVSTSLPVMHQTDDIDIAPSTNITAPTEQLLFFSSTPSITRSATTKSLSRPGTPHPLLLPAQPLRGRSSSLNSAISFTGSLDHRSMSRVRSIRSAASSRSPSVRSRTEGPRSASPCPSVPQDNINTSPQDQTTPSPVAPVYPQTKSGRASVVAFLSSAPVRSRIAPSQSEGGEVTSGVAGTLRSSPSSSSLTLQSTRRCYNHNVRTGLMKRRPSFESFDVIQRGGAEEDMEIETDALSSMTSDDNDSNDYYNDPYDHDKTNSAMTTTTTTATTETTMGAKKSKKMKMWCPTLSMFSFMMKSRKKL
ncbi:MAG: hypothetical protein J3Q66DRAFT_347150 [Benniella sp.]|nr:MAG: hypothetical protein J3Q66DRAFT_347150 [Benniella sp.]